MGEVARVILARPMGGGGALGQDKGRLAFAWGGIVTGLPEPAGPLQCGRGEIV